MSAGTMTIFGKARSAARTVFGEYVTEDEFESRQQTCKACKQAEMVKGIRYCLACGCPPIPRFALRWKNGSSGWRCPLGLW